MLFWRIFQSGFFTFSKFLAKFTNIILQWLSSDNLDFEEKPIGIQRMTNEEKIVTILENIYTIEQVANAKIYVQTSADHEYMAGTWFWYEWWRTVDLLICNNESKNLQELYGIIHAKDPVKEFDTNHEARGERMDSLMVSQFYGDNELKNMSITELFSR